MGVLAQIKNLVLIIILLLFHRELKFSIFILIFVDLLLHLVDGLHLILDLLLKLCGLLLIILQKFLLAIFELHRKFFFSFVAVFKSLFQEFYFLVQECLVLVELGLALNLLPLDFLMLILSTGHFGLDIFHLSLVFLLSLRDFLVKFVIELFFFFLNLL